eukprot:SAG31_NODE_4228_length_3442_cov_2.372719_3_plen_166_part_00
MLSSADRPGHHGRHHSVRKMLMIKPCHIKQYFDFVCLDPWHIGTCHILARAATASVTRPPGLCRPFALSLARSAGVPPRPKFGPVSPRATIICTSLEYCSCAAPPKWSAMICAKTTGILSSMLNKGDLFPVTRCASPAVLHRPVSSSNRCWLVAAHATAEQRTCP